MTRHQKIRTLPDGQIIYGFKVFVGSSFIVVPCWDEQEAREMVADKLGIGGRTEKSKKSARVGGSSRFRARRPDLIDRMVVKPATLADIEAYEQCRREASASYRQEAVARLKAERRKAK